MELKTFITEEDVQQRIRELGLLITSDLRHYEEIVCIGVLKGSLLFFADLIRQIPLPMRIDFMGVRSYEGTESTGHVQIVHDIGTDLCGKHVLVVEDIIDTGRTMNYLSDVIRLRQPASFRIATLLSKPEAHLTALKIDYVGFEISNEFVVGFGLDFNGLFRNLPYIAQIAGRA